ncbi:MFS transporter [Amycolatopsis jejuensis]|uniref:MFS transporter n=1 Tax=Amycolatopsis jejuensis TaxID=330084 RepID=UPI0005242D15|nr:MFS transporter [Amycolatopsis jejuensis]
MTLHTHWDKLLAGQVAVLILVNAMVDTVIGAPLLVLPQMLEHFGTDQAAWLNASAMLAGAVWAPLLGRISDLHGKRRVLVATLVAAAAGALVCLVAPNLGVFILGRLLQGAAVASMFLSVALIRDLCTPRVAMPVVGIVTSGSAVVSIVSPVLFQLAAARFGFQSVFVVSAIVGVLTAICVRGLMPESPVRSSGRIDLGGALLLGGGLAGMVGYLSLGSRSGWFGPGPLALLIAGMTAITWWFRVSSRKPGAVIDTRSLTRPLVLTLLVVVLGTGAYQSVLQLVSLMAAVSPGLGLGYGLATSGATGLLFAMPSIGIMAGGTLAGALATRIGPDRTLAAGVLLGVLGSAGMFAGASSFPAAMFFALVLGLTAGTLVTSGFNLAGSLAPAERQGSVSSLVTVMLAIGSVVVNFVSSAVLSSTSVVVGGTTMRSATGVFSTIAIALGAFLLAAIPAALLARRTALSGRAA